MFFDDPAEIASIASRTGTAIFVVPREKSVTIPGAILLTPEQKSDITIDQVRAITARTSIRQTSDLYVLVRPADKMNEAAASAFLKTLEQPGDRVHFALVTDRPDQLLPTIISRAALYLLRPDPTALSEVHGDERQKAFARELLVARGSDLVNLAQKITKNRENVKTFALETLRLAIEMAYKSYFRSPNPAFLTKLTALLAAYSEITAGGNIKLQIVANLC